MKKSNTNVLDRENLQFDESIRSVIKNETILLSSKVFKFNNYNKQQERVLLITNRAIYNLLPSGVVSGFMSILSSGARIKRKIALDKVHAITISRFGFEFLIHVLGEYDYRYSSIDFRDQILGSICQAFTVHNKTKKMPCHFKDDMILINYTTTKKDVAKKINRMPIDNPQLMDAETLRSAEGEKVQAEIIFNKSPTKNSMSIEDFQVIKVLGRGTFGKVMLCEQKKTHQIYAIKSLNKETIIQKDQIEHTKTEREILTRVNHPFLIQLVCAFQSEQKLFFVMPFIRGGELFHHLQKYKRFSEEWTKFYASCLVLCIEYIHELGYVYRDLKPENILINVDGYIILTDFGLAKKIKPGEYGHSFVGTADYLAPETIMNDQQNQDHRGHNYLIDWWGLGILIYEMIVGIPPFYHENQKRVFEYILNKEVKFPQSTKISDEAKDLIQKLLIKIPEKRLGCKKGAQEIKSHPWFSDINFDMLIGKQIQPPMIPQVGDKYDVNNFDKEFTSENPYFSMANQNENLVRQFDAEFQGMTYQQQLQ